MRKVNHAAVVIAAIAYFLLGAIWFTLLKNPWLAGVGKTEEELLKLGNPAAAYSAAFVCNLVIAYTIAYLFMRLGCSRVVEGAKLGAILWVGLVVTTISTELAFEAASPQFIAIVTGYPLLGMVVMGTIIAAWPAKADNSSAARA